MTLVNMMNLHIKLIFELLAADVFLCKANWRKIYTQEYIFQFHPTHRLIYSIQSYSHKRYIKQHILLRTQMIRNTNAYSVKIQKLLLFDGKPNKQFKIIDIDWNCVRLRTGRAWLCCDIALMVYSENTFLFCKNNKRR